MGRGSIKFDGPENNMEKLAINGGKKVIEGSLPTIRDKSGREIGDEELNLVTEVVRSGSLSFLSGDKVRKFEDDFSAMYGINTSVAVSSGTAALHTAVNFINVDPGDEVITSAITDMGTVIAILYQNAIPVFADVDPVTQTIDPDDIEKKISGRTKAIIVVHIYGHPCDMDPIMEIAGKNGLAVIEDCAQSLLTEYKGQKAGTIGDAGCFSFQQSKHITTGDGGMVITNKDDAFGRKLKQCADKGWPRHLYRDHLFLAPNYHMTELQAAVGIAQLTKLKRSVENRRKNARFLSSLIRDVRGIIPPVEREWAFHSYCYFCMGVNVNDFKVTTSDIAKALTAEGYEAHPGYLPMPIYRYDLLQKPFGKSEYPYSISSIGNPSTYKEGLCPSAEKICKETLYCPWNEKYTEENIQDIAAGIRKVAEYYQK